MIRIPTDKLIHFLGGMCICFIIGLFLPILGLIATVLVGIGKEVYDHVSKKGTPEINDAIATILGGLIAFIELLVVNNIQL